MRLISLAHLTVLDADPIGLVEVGKDGGFDAVGLRVVPPLASDKITPVVEDVPLQRRIKEALRATSMQILDIEAVWIQPDTDVGSLRPALEVGADLGARYVLTVGFDEERGRLADNFGAFCALAHSCGLRTMLEFIPYATIGTLAQAHDLLTEVAPADAGLLVDALHLSRSGGHPSDIARYDPALFSYIHLCDAPAILPSRDKMRPEARGGRLYPGKGQLWLMEFLDAFPTGTPVAVEAPDASLSGLPVAERACRAAEATRDLLRRHDGHAEAPQSH
jgi:sugar phosphate isomerase/epimerase